MKASKIIFNIYICIFFLFLLVFSYGCGGSGGHKDDDSIFIITGRVIVPEEASRQVQNVKSEKVTLWLEQQPTISTTCDENGYFTLNVPKISDSVNLIAFKGKMKDNDFRLQRSDDIFLTKEKTINIGELKLTPGKNSFLIHISDNYFNPIRYAQCSFWGFEILSDLNGTINFPKFPENITKIKATIKASGMKEFTDEFPVFTEDLGPDIGLSVYSYRDNKNPIVLSIDKYDYEPNPGQIVNFLVKIDDQSNLLNNKRDVFWFCNEGEILSEKENSLVWRAPPYPCLASITAYVLMPDYHPSVTFGVAVGKSRETKTKFTSFYPLRAAAGQTVQLFGSGFGDIVGNVYFKGATKVDILSWERYQIKVRVPDEAETGRITIKTADNKTLSSIEDFVCIDYTTKLSCNYGVPGTEITITGYGFGNTKENNSDLLYDNEKIGNIVSWTNRNITFKVEELSGAAPHTANLDLIIRGRKRSLGDFSVTYIKNLSPSEAQRFTYESEIERTVIRLTGEGFGNQDGGGLNKSSVKFLTYGEKNKEEYLATEIKSWTDDEIEVYLPPKAQTGNIILNINGYEMQGPKVTIIPAANYSEQVSARFSDSLMVTKPLITGVVIKDSDNVYLCDPQNYRLWYKDSDQYNYISTTDALYDYKPYTGAVNKEGEIILADQENKTLVKIVDGAIKQKSKFVFTGAPMGLCISNTTGYIYATDSLANKVIVFDSNLAKIDSFGSEGVGNGNFINPYGICLNSDETSIFVADSGNHRVQQFSISSDAEGKMEYIFKCWYGSFNGENGKHIKDSEFGESNNKKLGFISPSSVACDGSYIYITDIERNDIQKINLTNLSCEVIGEEGNGNSQFMKPTDIKLLGSNMYVADSENVRMQIISKVSTFIEQQKPELEGMNASFLGLSMNSDYDSLYIVDAVDCSVSKFDVYGTFEKKIGSKGSGVGQLLNPSDVMLDKEDNIWVADTGNRRLVMFPSNGGEAKSIGSGGSGNGQFKSPQRLAHNSTGDIFVSDCDKNVVMRFDNSGKYLYSIGQSELNRPFGLAIDSSDNLYVCDTGNHRICKYDANNQFEGWFGLAVSQEAGGWHEASEKSNGASGSAPCQFTTPMYLDLDNDDALYVLDYGSKKIQKLDTKNTGVLGGHICSVEVDADMFGIVVDDKDCFFLTTDDFVRKYVPAP